jgi:hypothetical protein
LSTDDATPIDFLEELVETFRIEIESEVVKQDEDEAFVIEDCDSSQPYLINNL